MAGCFIKQGNRRVKPSLTVCRERRGGRPMSIVSTAKPILVAKRSRKAYHCRIHVMSSLTDRQRRWSVFFPIKPARALLALGLVLSLQTAPAQTSQGSISEDRHKIQPT